MPTYRERGGSVYEPALYLRERVLETPPDDSFIALPNIIVCPSVEYKYMIAMYNEHSFEYSTSAVRIRSAAAVARSGPIEFAIRLLFFSPPAPAFPRDVHRLVFRLIRMVEKSEGG